MSALKCPNPTCPFLFDPSQVPPGAVLSCPRCAMQFTLGPSPGAPAAPPPGYGVPPGYGAPPPGYGAPTPGYGAPPPGYGYAPTGVADDFAEDAESPETGRAPQRRRSGGFFSTLLVMVTVVGVFMVGMTSLYLSMRSKHGLITNNEGGDTRKIWLADFNCGITKPPEPWIRDQETQNQIGVNVVAYKRPEPQAWMAFGVSDYEVRSPTLFELHKRMSDQLLRVFDNLPETLDTTPTKWAGLDAQKCEFRGIYMPTGDTCYGYCYLLAHKGVGYWLYVWAPERHVEQVGGEMAAMVDGFRLMSERDKWGEKAPDQRVYRGKDGSYRLTDYARIWEKPKNLDPKDEDELADLVLQSVLKGKERLDFPPTADLVVLILPESPGEPLGAARIYVEKRLSYIPDVSITEWTGEPAGDPPLGPENDSIPVTRLRVTGGADADPSSARLIVFSALAVGDKTIVAETSCKWKEREIWERRMMQIVRSLRAEGAPAAGP